MDLCNGSAKAYAAIVESNLRSRNLTWSYAEVLLALNRYRFRDGIYPSIDTIAKAASVSARTVHRALAHAASLGLVMWMQRTKGKNGRSSNRYFLLIPPGPIVAGKRPMWPRRGVPANAGAGQVSKKESSRLQEVIHSPAAAQAIGAIAMARKAMLDAAYIARKYA